MGYQLRALNNSDVKRLGATLPKDDRGKKMHKIFTQLVPLGDFNKIRFVKGFDRISTEYPAYLTDESKLSPKPFDFLFFPMDEPELAAIFEHLSQQKIQVTIAGARTGLVGGCAPKKGALVSLENFDKISF